MSVDLPPPPGTLGPSSVPPAPPSPPGPSRVRLWLAAIMAVSALAGLAALLAVAFEPAAETAVLFRDDFSDGAESSRWLEADDERGSMGRSEGRYRIAVTDGGEMQSIARLDEPETELRVEVDGTMAQGTGGLSVLCVSELSGSPGEITSSGDRGIYYDFFLSFADEAYAILSSTQPRAPLNAGEDASGVLRDGPNRIVVRCAGAADGRPAQLSLTVNGTEVLTHAHPDGAETFRAVGLTVFSESGPAEATFDDVTVSTG